MNYDFFAISKSGGYRVTNEDRVMVDGNILKNGEIAGHTEGHFLAVICDGVGGSAFGEKAADTAILSMRSSCETKQDSFSLCSALFKADDEIKAEQAKGESQAEMKTTIAALYIDENGYLALNAGDTRIYKVDERKIELLSVDHTSANEMLGLPRPPSDEDSLESYSSTITRFLGARNRRLKPSIAGDISSYRDEDIFLICSDGTYNGIGDEDLADIINYPLDLSEKGRLLYHLAKRRGVRDNISLVLVAVSG